MQLKPAATGSRTPNTGGNTCRPDSPRSSAGARYPSSPAHQCNPHAMETLPKTHKTPDSAGTAIPVAILQQQRRGSSQVPATPKYTNSNKEGGCDTSGGRLGR